MHVNGCVRAVYPIIRIDGSHERCAPENRKRTTKKLHKKQNWDLPTRCYSLNVNITRGNSTRTYLPSASAMLVVKGNIGRYGNVSHDIEPSSKLHNLNIQNWHRNASANVFLIFGNIVSHPNSISNLNFISKLQSHIWIR